MGAVITFLICMVPPVIAVISMHFKFAYERWVSYLEQKSSYQYITVSPKIFGTINSSRPKCCRNYEKGDAEAKSQQYLSLHWCAI